MRKWFKYSRVMKCLIKFGIAIERRSLAIENFDFKVYRMTQENFHKIIPGREEKQYSKPHILWNFYKNNITHNNFIKWINEVQKIFWEWLFLCIGFTSDFPTFLYFSAVFRFSTLRMCFFCKKRKKIFTWCSSPPGLVVTFPAWEKALTLICFVFVVSFPTQNF